MLSTIFIGKFYAGVKKLVCFDNENFFPNVQNASTFLLRREIFPKNIADNICPS